MPIYNKFESFFKDFHCFLNYLKKIIFQKYFDPADVIANLEQVMKNRDKKILLEIKNKQEFYLSDSESSNSSDREGSNQSH